MASNIFPFTINIVGESTGESFVGSFEAKLRLAHRDKLTKDQIRRSFLGQSPEAASRDALIRTEMFSHTKVSITKAPTWWTESDGGLELFDDNVILAVYEKIADTQDEAVAALKKKAEESKAVLAKDVETPVEE